MKKTALAAILLSLVLALTGCGLGGAPDGAGVKADDYSFAQAQESDRYSDFDLSETWDNTATVVSFDKDKIEVNGTGAEDAGGDLRITKAGTYVASGELNGSITVNCGDSDNVKLVLNGVKITSDDGAAIIVENADKLLITLAADTENELNDADTRDDDAEDIACIYSHDDLTVNGSGSLTVNGNYKNGIEGNDDVKLVNGSITVNAVNNAIKGKDSLYIKDGTLTVKIGEGSQAAEMKSGDDFGDGGGMRRQMPQGEIGEIPSIPEDATDENGNLIDRGGFGGNGEWPQNGERPDIGAGGDFSLPQGGPPEMPDGEMPEMPGGNMPEMPQRPDGDVPQASEGRAPQATSTSLTGSGSVTSIEKADVVYENNW